MASIITKQLDDLYIDLLQLNDDIDGFVHMGRLSNLLDAVVYAHTIDENSAIGLFYDPSLRFSSFAISTLFSTEKDQPNPLKACTNNVEFCRILVEGDIHNINITRSRYRIDLLHSLESAAYSSSAVYDPESSFKEREADLIIQKGIKVLADMKKLHDRGILQHDWR